MSRPVAADTLDQVLAEDPAEFFLLITFTCAHAATSHSNEVSSRSREGRRSCLPEQADSNWIGSPSPCRQGRLPPWEALHLQAKDHPRVCAAEGNGSLENQSCQQD